MAERIRPGTEIRDFTPDDTETDMYLSCEIQSYTFPDILEKAKEKWGPDTKFENLRITPEYIHCYCLGYDRYDPDDYVNYLLIQRIV